jgi:WD40 repeat protein
LKAHVGAITAMATDPKGKTLYTAGADNFIRFWEISNGKMIKVSFLLEL